MTDAIHYSTSATAQHERSDRWRNVISEAYFPLEMQFREPSWFNGSLTRAAFGEIGLSRTSSDPISYERRDKHVQEAQEEEYLVTIPRVSTVSFSQLGRDVSCGPGGFIIERGDEPYRFSYEAANDLVVLKVSQKTLSERVRQPDRFCARAHDATEGIANLFVSMACTMQAQSGRLERQLRDVIGRQLLDLLALTFEATKDARCGTSSSVRLAHLARIDRTIRANIKNPKLTPDLVAVTCGISKRYVHDLFRDSDSTLGRHIREQRLFAARDDLAASPRMSIAEVAYRFCFADQAQFSRLFKARFGATPSEFRAAARGGT